MISIAGELCVYRNLSGSLGPENLNERPFIKSNLRRVFESTIEIKLERPDSIIILCDTTALCTESNF